MAESDALAQVLSSEEGRTIFDTVVQSEINAEVIQKIVDTQPINSDAFEKAFGQKPITLCIDDAPEPPDIHLLKRLVCHVPIPPLPPKHWVPKGEYVEMTSGQDHTYIEKIVPKSEMKSHITAGWRITRLTKVSKGLVYKKWHNAIIAMESNDAI
ncbi:hypothetical protein CPT_Minot_042 [Acinetobacter phage Minot]|nr:hypothetical protein CPT_Minot_042 [Acinetobacter phage Minot]QQO96494.1 hypothetical protein CPT_Mokit_043 [Acinetobacter phage Mokit]